MGRFLAYLVGNIAYLVGDMAYLVGNIAYLVGNIAYLGGNMKNVSNADSDRGRLISSLRVRDDVVNS